MCPTGTSLHLILPSDDATSGFRRAFDVIDVDHDGKISSNDLQNFYTTTSAFGDNDDGDMIRAMISVADDNKDGYVEYDEFERLLLKNNNNNYYYNDEKKNDKEKVVVCCEGGDKGDDIGVMCDVFKVMDKDGDGRLGVDDLRTYLNFAGINNIGDDEIKAMIQLGGGNVNDGVSFDGFLNILALHH